MTINEPKIWLQALPEKAGTKHKYDYGHAVIYGAPELTGATRLAATACARMGTGLTTVIAAPEVSDIYRITLPPHIMVRSDLHWSDPRITARLYGSGGLSVRPSFNKKTPVVLDADAIDQLPERLSENYVLTPHEGEFARAFPDMSGTRIERAQRAAQAINAHVVLKGEETIICSPGGEYIINQNASPHLASAGTGDVLAGMITGLLAQNMPIFQACCAAVWMHGECAKRIGAGLVASDIEAQIPAILKDLSL